MVYDRVTRETRNDYCRERPFTVAWTFCCAISIITMATLRGSCGHYILQRWFLSSFVFPPLFSAAGDWMPT